VRDAQVWIEIMEQLKVTDTQHIAVRVLRASSSYASKEESLKIVTNELRLLPMVLDVAIVQVQRDDLTVLRCSSLEFEDQIRQLGKDLSKERFDSLFNSSTRPDVEDGDDSASRQRSFRSRIVSTGRKTQLASFPVGEDLALPTFILLSSRAPLELLTAQLMKVEYLFELAQKVLLTQSHSALDSDTSRTHQLEIQGFRRVFRHLEVPALLVDQEHHVLEANQAFYSLSESIPSEVLGSTIDDFLEVRQDLPGVDEASDIKALGIDKLSPISKDLAVLRTKRPIVVTFKMTPLKIDSKDQNSCVVTLQDFDQEYRTLLRSVEDAQLLRNAVAEAPLQIILARTSGEVLESEGRINEIESALSQKPFGAGNIKLLLKDWGMSSSQWDLAAGGVRQRFSLDVGSVRLRVWLSLTGGHLESGEFHVSVVVVNISKTLKVEALLGFRESAGRAVLELSEKAITYPNGDAWSEAVRQARSVVYEQGSIAQRYVEDDQEMLKALDKINLLFSLHISQIEDVRQGALASIQELNRLSKIHPQLLTYNRRTLIEQVEKDGFVGLGPELDFTLVKLSNLERIRDSIGVEKKDELLRLVIERAREYISESVMLFSLSPVELMFVATSTPKNRENLSRSIQSFKVPMRSGGLMASLTYSA